MKKIWMLLGVMLVTALIISGCGSSDEGESAEETEADASEEEGAEAEELEAEESEVEENAEDEEAATEEESEEETEEASASAGSAVDFSEMISYIEEETQGTTNVMYENSEPQSHTMEDVTVTLDAYTLVELTDFHTDFSIPFNDQTNGGVIIARYTVTNEMDEDVHYMPSFYLSFTGAQKSYNNYRNLLPLEEQLPSQLSPDNDYLLEAGESVTGYYTYPFGEDHLEEVLDVSTASVEVPEPQTDMDDFSSTIGSQGQFTLSLNEDGEARAEENAAFFQDKVTVDDMGDKEMLEEEDDIGESETLGDVEVTLDGYQYTEFTPNDEEAPRFENFANGIVLLTVKFQLDNGGADAVDLSSTSSKLTVNDGAQYMLNEGMLLPYSYGDVTEAGESGELLQIYTLDQEQYEKIWKDKAFEVELGPIRDDEATDISKGKTAVFSF